MFSFWGKVYFSLRYGVREIGWFDKRAKFLWTEERVGVEWTRIERNPLLNKKRTRLFPISRSRWYFRVPTFVLLDLWFPDYPQFANNVRSFFPTSNKIIPEKKGGKYKWKCIFRRVKKSSIRCLLATLESFIRKYNTFVHRNDYSYNYDDSWKRCYVTNVTFCLCCGGIKIESSTLATLVSYVHETSPPHSRASSQESYSWWLVIS